MLSNCHHHGGFKGMFWSIRLDCMSRGMSLRRSRSFTTTVATAADIDPLGKYADVLDECLFSSYIGCEHVDGLC